MSEASIVMVLFGSFLALLILGAPVMVSLGIAALASFFYLDENPIKFVQIAFNSVGSFPLMALPAFILAGALMEASGISKRLVTLAESFAGPVTGGMSAAAILACMFFGAISGSGPATTAAVGMLMIPAMVNRGYDKGYASAVTASSGGLGIVIPPSIPMVIFGISALGLVVPLDAIAKHGEFQSISIPKMFIAGFLPGVVMSVGLMTLNYIQCRRYGFKGSGEGWSIAQIGKAARSGIWSILAPLVILGGIYSGFFTPTESAIIAIFYTLFVGIFIHKELKMKDLIHSLETTTWLSGRVLLILFTATAFGRILVENQIPGIVAESMLSLTDNLYLIWLLIIAFLLFVGMFMETLAAIMILTPVLLPVAYTLGIDPVHFGIVMVCSLSIGFSTPPLGENLFVASGISDTPLEEVTAKALPFAFVSTIMVIIIAYIPQIALTMPRLLGY
ncbi:TRAP transporter large permease [Psychromonas sp. 14N.309.X.WAT.B.A12]|uniref:TRAP transporter large permease n=1 Tax=unclassified Psychromonas TaxID=2614957 RepID=UPI0025B0076D|nr:TRAP transporter large permease [Psychromonas sp. 14N.309.X.WAT.B.A12]MDN2663404.1 TRAP transporter large permease [Psychromonas sp. 14N.309.X.WAT.B.A12]